MPKGLLLVRLSIVMLGLLVLCIIMLAIFPLLQGGIQVKIPPANETYWYVQDEAVHADLNVSIYNGGLLAIRDFQFWVDIQINGTNHFFKSDSIKVSLPGGKWTTVTLPVQLKFSGLERGSLQMILFEGTVVRVNGGMTTNAAANLVHLEANLLDTVNFPVPSVVSEVNVSAAQAKLRSAAEGWELELPYRINTTGLARDGNGTLYCQVRNGTAMLGNGSVDFSAIAPSAGNLTIPLSDQEAESLLRSNDTLYIDVRTELFGGSGNFTLVNHWQPQAPTSSGPDQGAPLAFYPGKQGAVL